MKQIFDMSEYDKDKIYYSVEDRSSADYEYLDYKDTCLYTYHIITKKVERQVYGEEHMMDTMYRSVEIELDMTARGNVVFKIYEVNEDEFNSILMMWELQR